MQQAGKLIVIDGLDGAGKTTLVQHVTRALQRQQIPVTSLVTVGQGPIGKAIRQTVLHGTDPVSKHAEALYLAASIIESFEHFVKPALKAGTTVILDRHISTYYAYQCHLQNNPTADFIFRHTLNNDRIMAPIDLYLYCDISIEVSNARLELRPEKKDNFDNISPAIKEGRLVGYKKYYDWHHHTHKDRIDASLPIEQVRHNTLQCIDDWELFPVKLTTQPELF